VEVGFKRRRHSTFKVHAECVSTKRVHRMRLGRAQTKSVGERGKLPKARPRFAIESEVTVPVECGKKAYQF